MDEPSWDGTADEVRDASGFGHHGTLSGSVDTTEDGRFGRAGAFDGSGWIEVPDTEALRPSTALSVSAWIWPDSLGSGAWPGIVTKRSGFQDQSAFSLHVGDTKYVTVDIAGEDDRFRAPTALGIDRWYHVAFVYDGTLPEAERVKLYIDGVLVMEAVETSATIPAYSSPVLIGNLPGGGSVFDGRIDEVAVWRRALGDDEVFTLSLGAIPDAE